MSIASAIQNAQTKVANAYTAVSGKGGTLPTTQDLSNLPTAINSITELKGETKTVNPSTTSQTITPSSGKNGITEVTVNAVTASIDSDIVAGNIKSGVNILGVNGSVTELKGQTKTITPTTSTQTITPDSTYNGLTSVKVNAVTSSIDSNIQAGNIKSGATILGVSGTVTALAGETRTVSITSTSGNTFTPSSGKNGITSIKVNPTNQNRTVTPSTSSQTLSVNSGYSGNGTISVSAVTSTIDQNIQPENIKKDTVILGITGTYEGSSVNITDISNANYVVNVSYQALLMEDTNNNTLGLLQDTINTSFRQKYSGSTSIKRVYFNAVKTIQNGGSLYRIFYNSNSIEAVEFASLEKVEGQNVCSGMCWNSYNVSSITFPKLKQIGSNTTSQKDSGQFESAFLSTKITTMTFPELEQIYCTSGSNFSDIGTGTFANNSNITIFNFPKLHTITNSPNAPSMTATRTQIFSGCSGLVEIHFGTVNRNAIEATAGYSTAWGRGAGNVTIYFDL